MSAGSADFTIEQGADWAVQIYWVNEQTGDAIMAQGPMEMDIVQPVTGQRLIRLDDGSNGGIDTGGAPYGIIQLSIDRDTTQAFAAGNYIYDLFVFSVGPPLQRVRLLQGNVTVAPEVTSLGVALGQIVNAGVLPPDIILDTAVTAPNVVFSFDTSEPTNQMQTPETGVPMRAGLKGVGNYPSADLAVYLNTDGSTTGPVRDSFGVQITGAQVNNWLTLGAVVTVCYSGQTNGLIVSKVESEPGGPSSPTVLVTEGAVNA